MDTFAVRAPASTANLGPAFDCLGLALDLWNEASFTVGKKSIEIDGEGADTLPKDKKNLILRAFYRAFKETGEKAPKVGLRALNRIPLNSGMGSSAAACACGLLAANHLLEDRFNLSGLLQLGAAIEGHADNLAAALYGGAVLVSQDGERFEAHPIGAPTLSAVVLLPEISYSTNEARKRLPKKVALQDAVFNLGQAMLLVEALRAGEIEALAAAMQDRLHQPQRLKLITGGAEALVAAQAAGAAAAISGSGPSLIAFTEEGREKAITEALRAPFGERGIKSRLYLLKSSPQGAGLISAE